MHFHFGVLLTKQLSSEFHLTAEERLKDKLATAARDKLAASSKEKQLQAERKKKAALFINLLRIVKESPMSSDKSKEDADAGVYILCLHVCVRVWEPLHMRACMQKSTHTLVHTDTWAHMLTRTFSHTQSVYLYVTPPSSTPSFLFQLQTNLQRQRDHHPYM